MDLVEINITPYNNYVIIKPDMDMGGTNVDSFSVDTSFTPHAHVPRTGTVIAVPDELIFDEDSVRFMPWETKMELKVGDEVTYHYLSAMTAEDKHAPRWFEFNGEKYYFIKYDRIYTAKRRWHVKKVGNVYYEVDPHDIIICLNGFVLVEPIQDQELLQYEKHIVIPDVKDATFGIVRYMGSLVTNYGKMYKDWHGPDTDRVNIGDTVVMDNNCNIPLQYSFHANIEDNKEFYRVQRRYLLGSIEK